MTEQDIITIARQTIWIIVQTSMPVLVISMIVGLVISLIQTITFVPKMLSIFITLMILGSWMINRIVEFITQLWGNFGQYIH